MLHRHLLLCSPPGRIKPAPYEQQTAENPSFPQSPNPVIGSDHPILLIISFAVTLVKHFLPNFWGPAIRAETLALIIPNLTMQLSEVLRFSFFQTRQKHEGSQAKHLFTSTSPVLKLTDCNPWA